MQKSVGSFVKSPWRGGTLTGYECFVVPLNFPLLFRSCCCDKEMVMVKMMVIMRLSCH